MTVSEWSNWRFYNRTTSAYIGGNITQNAVTKASPSLSASIAVAIVSASVDTSVDFRLVSIGSGAVTCTDGDVYVTIEELEEFIPQSSGSTTINGNLQVTGGIIGKTDGVAPAAGMVGETLRQVDSSTVNTITDGAETTVYTQVLTAGAWNIVVHCTGGCNGNNSLTSTVVRLKIDGTIVDRSQCVESSNSMVNPRQSPSTLHWAGVVAAGQIVSLTITVTSPGACVVERLLQCQRVA